MSQAVLKWFRPEVSKWLRCHDLSPTISNIRKAILAIKKEGGEDEHDGDRRI